MRDFFSNITSSEEFIFSSISFSFSRTDKTADSKYFSLKGNAIQWSPVFRHYAFFFTYPLIPSYVPPGVRVPQVEKR
jgi:hypothetical protein